MEGKRFAALPGTVAVAGVPGGAASNLIANGRLAFAERREPVTTVGAEKIELHKAIWATP